MAGKYKPILFSTDMVRAILRKESPKTVTRRAIKPQPGHNVAALVRESDEWIPWTVTGGCLPGRVIPPWRVGDRLWVREAFAPFVGAMGRGAIYKADDTHRVPLDLCLGEKWKPSIHMPRAYSRITLEVVSVTAERLLDITEEDAMAEGVEPVCMDEMARIPVDIMAKLDSLEEPSYALGFFSLWVRIYGYESLIENPLVWRNEFNILK